MMKLAHLGTCMRQRYMDGVVQGLTVNERQNFEKLVCRYEKDGWLAA
jgi:hypothetical protein